MGGGQLRHIALLDAEKKRIKVFIDETHQRGIAVAGWEWCQGTDAKGDSVHPHLPIALLDLDAAGIHRRSRLTTLSVSIIEGFREAPLPDNGLMSCCTEASPRVLLCNGLRSRIHGCNQVPDSLDRIVA
jgi:hypothetical protein